MNNELSPKMWQLLSAYLDGQLNERDIRKADELLRQNDSTREALDMLRRTRVILRATPMRKAPRNFAIKPEMVKKPFIPPFTAVLRFSSAMAALLLVAVLAIDSLGLSAPMVASRAVEDAAPEMMALEAPAAEMAPAEKRAEPPPIIIWGGLPPMMAAYGKGGGGGGAAEPAIGGGAEGPGFGVGGGGGISGFPPPALPLPEEIMPMQEEQQANQLSREPLTGSGPILGVRPPAAREALREPGDAELPDGKTGLAISFATIELILAALLVITAIPAWLLRRK
jgi:hypothetical protein